MLPTTILGLTLDQWEAVVTFLAAVVTIVGFPLLLRSLHFASRLDQQISEQLSELQTIAQSQNTIALNTMVFNDPINVLIMGAIAAHEPILKEHGGTFLSISRPWLRSIAKSFSPTSNLTITSPSSLSSLVRIVRWLSTLALKRIETISMDYEA